MTPSVHLRSTNWSHATRRRPALSRTITGRHANQRCQCMADGGGLHGIDREPIQTRRPLLLCDWLQQTPPGCTFYMAALWEEHRDTSGANYPHTVFAQSLRSTCCLETNRLTMWMLAESTTTPQSRVGTRCGPTIEHNVRWVSRVDVHLIAYRIFRFGVKAMPEGENSGAKLLPSRPVFNNRRPDPRTVFIIADR